MSAEHSESLQTFIAQVWEQEQQQADWFRQRWIHYEFVIGISNLSTSVPYDYAGYEETKRSQTCYNNTSVLDIGLRELSRMLIFALEHSHIHKYEKPTVVTC